MTILQSIEGKFYELPEDQASAFEIPRDKMKELLGKVGKNLAPQAGPEGGPAPQRMPAGGPGGMPGGSPVVVQIFPNGMHGPAAGPGGPAPSAAPGEGEGDVEPYWFWQNFRNPYTGYWLNRWWY